MKHVQKLIALLLVLTMLFPAEALAAAIDPMSKEPPETTSAPRQEQLLDSEARIEPVEEPSADEMVTAIIELREEPLVSLMSDGEIPVQEEAALLAQQEAVEQEISAAVLDGQEMEILYNYTVVTNGFAARVPYGALEEIRAMSEVERVYVAPVFKVAPNMEAKTSEMGGLENATGYRGEGKVIAIVDSGLAMDHPAFAAAPNTPALAQTNVAAALDRENFQAEAKYAVNGQLTASQVYHGGKVPFAFDYADRDLDVNPGNAGDHGTHVAGIAAANAGVTADVVGVAPEAQLLAMKVFSSYGAGLATWEDILAAMDDSVYLGADVINMSLGSTCGFSSYDWEDGVGATLQRVTDAGVSLSIACGNEYGAAYFNRMGKSHALTQNPDYGTVASPSSYDAALAVASVEKQESFLSSYLTVGERKVAFNDITEAPDLQLPETAPSFKSLGTGTALSYVVIPGVGEAADYAGLDVTGKIALVARGSVNYEIKKNAARAAGAAGLLVYNNEPGMSYMQMDTYDLPAAFISQADGRALAELPEAQRVLTIAAERSEIENPTSGLMSDFSSWGVTPELTLKPDITAPGANIKSTTVNGGYTTKSGTSMATPFVSGAIAVTRQYLEQQHPGAFSTAGEKASLADSLLMSTARQVTVNGMPYSPRKQGAGLVSLDSAMHSSGYLSVAGSARPKLALGDDAARTGAYTLTFDVHNWTDSPVTYTLGGTVQTDAAEITKQYMEKDVWQVTELPYLLEAAIDARTVEVPAGQTRTVTVQVNLTAADKAYLDGTFPNGSYVEGFVTLTPDDNSAVLSLPYMAFYGDWTHASLIDRGYFWNDLKGEENWATQYTNTAASTSLERTVDTYLGDNPYHMGVPYLQDRSAISPNKDDYMDSLDILYTGLLRNAETLTYTITNPDDPTEIYYQKDMDHVTKSVYQGSYYRIVPAGVDDYTKIDPWDGKNHGISLPNNSKALVTVTATLPYDGHAVDNECLSWSFPVTIDTEEPVIKSVKVREEGNKFFVDLVVSDNQYVSNICFADATGDTFLQSFPVAETEPGMTTELSFDVTGLGAKLTLIVNDYACNRREQSIKVDGNIDESQVIVPTKSVFLEDFETDTFPANGWTVQNQSAKTWYQVYEYGSQMASCAVDRAAQQNEWLISPVIDLSRQETKAGLIFDFYTSWYWSTAQHAFNLKVKASTDGRAWEDIWQLWDLKSEFGAFEKTQAKVLIPEKFQKSPTLQLAFVYEGTDGTEFWMDNVQVYVEDPSMTHTITASAGPGGTITPEGTVKISHDMDRTFTMTPDQGYILADVKVDGTSVGPKDTYTFEKVTADHTIEAVFSAQEGGDTALLINEDFEKNEMPAGWSRTGINDAYSWKVQKYWGHLGAYCGVDTYDPDPSYNCPGNAQDEYLKLPVVDLSGRTAASLSFQFSGNRRELENGNMTATVAASTDGGQNWTTLWNARDVLNTLKDGVISDYVGTGDQTVQLPADCLVRDLQLAFRYEHPARSDKGGPAFFDNVKLLAQGGGSVNPEPDPEPQPPVSGDLLHEDFEGQTMPEGWQVKSTNATTWKVQKYFQHWGAYCSVDSYEDSGWGGGWSADAVKPMGDGFQDERLITPALAMGGKTGTLSFQFTANKGMLKSGAMTATVDLSKDGGQTWTEIWNAKDNLASLQDGVISDYVSTGDISLEIPAEFQVEDLLIAFRYQHSRYSADGGPVFVDNVIVTAQGGATPEPPANAFIITASAGQGGSIEPRGEVKVARDASQTFTITASQGYELADVLVDGVSVGKVPAYTFEKVDKAHAIEASFTKLPEVLPTEIREDFNAAAQLPEKWTVDGPSANYHYETWKAGRFDALNDSNVMLCNQNIMFAQKQNEKLILPEIRMADSAVLTFDWGATVEHIRSGMIDLTVQASLYKGSSWTTIWDASEQLPAEPAGTEITGKAEVKIPANFCVPGARFAFVFDSVTRSDGTAAIDNVYLGADHAGPAPSLYAITVAAMENGTVVPSRNLAAEGETITLDVKPAAGYQLKAGSLMAGDIVVEGNSFVMPARAVEISALFEAAPTPPAPAGYKDGVYEGQAQGAQGLVKVRVTVTDGAVANVEVLEQKETESFWTKAVAIIDKLIGKTDNESIQAVDTVTGATLSSTAIKAATLNALEKAANVDSGIFDAGSGTEKLPYVIHTVQQLLDFSASVNAGEAYRGKFIALDQDLSLKEVDWTPIGTADHDKYTGFAGTFDGRGHTVSDITCGVAATPKNLEAMGFFGVIEKGGQVRNLNLQITKYYNTCTTTDMVYVGGLAGILDRNAVIDHCTVASADLTISEASSVNCAMGAMVGKMGTGSIIANSWTNAGLSYGAMNFSDPVEAAVGGIAGVQAKDSLIVNSASFGTVAGMVMTGMLRIGGLAGETEGALYNCYTTSTTKANILGTDVSQLPAGTTAIGHLIGNSKTGAALYQCYYDKNAAQFSNVDLAGEPSEGKAERRQAAGWDPTAQIRTDLSHVTACDAAELITAAFAETMNGGLKTVTIGSADAYFKTNNLGTDLVSGGQSLLNQGFYRWELCSGVVLPESTQKINITVEDVAIQNDLLVALGTPREQLPLPRTVAVTLSTGVVVEMPVVWDTSAYVTDAETSYQFLGEVTLPEGVTNPNHHKARINVIVKKEAADLFRITVAPMEHGTVEVSPVAAKAGAVITVTVKPDAGYSLKIGSLKANDKVIPGSTFEMPAEDVTITAVFEQPTTPPSASDFEDGVYEGEARGRNGLVKVRVTVRNGSVAKIDILSQNESEGFWEKATAILETLLGKRTKEEIGTVDTVTGATLSSTAIKEATLDALKKASKVDSGIFASGDGSVENPYVIRTVKQLTDFAASVNAGESYKDKLIVLDSDLSLAGVDWVPIGTSDHDKYTGFAGTFDGQGYTVYDVTMGKANAMASFEAAGFFGVIEAGGQVRSLNVRIQKWYNERSEADTVYMGGLVGILDRNAAVDHCTVTGPSQCMVEGSGKNGAMGGIAGKMGFGSTIANSWTDVGLNYGTINPDKLDVALGGIAGTMAKESLIVNCASFGTAAGQIIDGILRVGGLAGETEGALYNCYTTGITKANTVGLELDKLPAGTTAIGHLIGNSRTGAALYQCYYDKNAPQFSNTDLAGEPAEGKPERRQAAGWDPVEKIDTDLSQVTACESAELVVQTFADTMNTGLISKNILQAGKYFETKKLLQTNAIAQAEAALKNGFYRWELLKDRVLLGGTQSQTLTVISVARQPVVTAANGTALESLQLPETVKITLSNQKVVDAAVTWTCESYDGTIAGDYTFTGELTMPAGVTNPGGWTAALTVRVCRSANQIAADKVRDLIEKIGDVTLEDQQAIEAARKAYDELTDEQKALVDNYNKLTEAEQALEKLLKDKADQEAADKVRDLIEKIGDVTLEDQQAIEAARKAYDELTDEQKALVDNLDKLIEAEKELEELQKPRPNPSEPVVPFEPKVPELPFLDVAEDAWYRDAVEYVYTNKLMNGVTDTLFAPNQSTSRAMVVTVLYRMAGSPKAAAREAFTDVAADTWYSDAVAWASANGIVGGYGNGQFGPDDNVTREQLVSILFRYAKKMGYATGASRSLTGFTDAAQVSDWAGEAMEWAYGIGLIDGVGDGRLMPQGNATRAQIAAILMRFAEKVVK